MDWGLAKRLRDPAAAANEQRPAKVPCDIDSLAAVDLTRPGAVMGTYAYMPPEQARGQTGNVDARADVFALGAILCQILTGCPPYSGTTAKDVWQQAAAGNLTDAMAVLKQHTSAEGFLEARLATLAIRCLAPEPSGRPAHAGEVAVAVTAALTRAAESHREAELSQVRTDVDMCYGKHS